MQYPTMSNADRYDEQLRSEQLSHHKWCTCDACVHAKCEYRPAPAAATITTPSINVSAQFSPTHATLTMSPEDLARLVEIARTTHGNWSITSGMPTAHLDLLTEIANVNIPSDSW